ncbi:hypothetical protein IAR50_001095 [Cryptococcus sp. DSM 104548]
MACQQAAEATLYSTSTSLILQTATSSSAVTYTPSPSTSTWTITACATASAARDNDVGNVMVSASSGSDGRRRPKGASLWIRPTVALVRRTGQRLSTSGPKSSVGTTPTPSFALTSSTTTSTFLTTTPSTISITRFPSSVTATALSSISSTAASSLRARSRRQWRGDDANSDAAEGSPACQTITSSTIIGPIPSTSWSTTYITSTITSTVMVPTQTVWGGCDSIPSTEWAEATSSSWADMSSWSSSSSEWAKTISASWAIESMSSSASSDSDEGYWVGNETSSSSEVDGGWSSSSSWAQSWSASSLSVASVADGNSFVDATSSTSSTTSTSSSASTTTAMSTPPYTSAYIISPASDTSTSIIIPTSTTSTSVAAAAAASGASTSSITTSSAFAAEDTSPHVSKSVSISAAVGGIFGLLAFLASCLLGLRWWKKRGRVQRTRELRSSWIYGGDVSQSTMSAISEKGVVYGDSESQLGPGGGLPQSRFSAPSFVSRSAIPSLLRQPISHMRQGSGRFPPILSLKHLLSGSNAEQSARVEADDGAGSWVDKYTAPPLFYDTKGGAALSRNVSPSRAMDSPFDTPSRPKRPGLTISFGDGVTWGAYYTSPTVAQLQHQQWNHTQGMAGEIDHAALSEASHSVYSRRSTYSQGSAFSRGNTLRSMRAEGEGGANEAAATFPLPPYHPSVHSRSLSGRTLPPPPLPEIPAITFPPDFPQPVSQDYSNRITRSTLHSSGSGTWEFSGYADSSRHTPISGTVPAFP